jgi:hypothetical protein
MHKENVKIDDGAHFSLSGQKRDLGQTSVRNAAVVQHQAVINRVI